MDIADITKERIIELLAEIPDPEIPVINIVELGIVRDVTIKSDGLTVKITPTYSGCPAMVTANSDSPSLTHESSDGSAFQ